ncbi:hypothetical protein J437_LFUL019442, partial [Ladona fulva]
KVQHSVVKDPIAVSTDRYFRIPFIRPSKSSGEVGVPTQGMKNEARGWWYAHFHGQYVARQMELHPNKPSVLLIA